jgi:hypothetical protein
VLLLQQELPLHSAQQLLLQAREEHHPRHCLQMLLLLVVLLLVVLLHPGNFLLQRQHHHEHPLLRLHLHLLLLLLRLHLLLLRLLHVAQQSSACHCRLEPLPQGLRQSQQHVMALQLLLCLLTRVSAWLSQLLPPHVWRTQSCGAYQVKSNLPVLRLPLQLHCPWHASAACFD